MTRTRSSDEPAAGRFLQRRAEQYQDVMAARCRRAIEAAFRRRRSRTALAFYDGYRSERLPANLLQAQRDFFGAHTYERIDKPRGEFFHTNWTGRGGRVRPEPTTPDRIDGRQTHEIRFEHPPGRRARFSVPGRAGSPAGPRHYSFPEGDRVPDSRQRRRV